MGEVGVVKRYCVFVFVERFGVCGLAGIVFVVCFKFVARSWVSF